jgi:hypothetical protein
MRSALPTRYRHPLDDPDPALARQYDALFARGLSPPPQDQIDLLAQALMRGDPLAEAWLRVSRTLGREESARLLEQASTHGVDSLHAAPSELVALFRQLETVPSWVSPEKLRLGAMAYRRTGVLGHFVLSDFGLMGGYRSSAVAKTLMMTGKLRYGAAERLIHTGRFVTAATNVGEILPGTPGYASTIRVRMVHAMVRSALLASPRWRTDAWGLPINQSDTLGTNLLFSIGLLEGCKQWGLCFHDAEIDAIVHLWRYIGYLIGIDEALLPTDEASARRALYAVGVSQPEPDQDSRELARALYEVPLSFERPAWVRRIIRGEMALRLAMTRRILGDEGVDQLGLPQSQLGPLLPPIVGLIGAFERARQRIPGASYAAYRVGDFLTKKGGELLDAELARRASAARGATAQAEASGAAPAATPVFGR